MNIKDLFAEVHEVHEALIHKKNAELEKTLVETRRAEVGKCDAVSNRFGDVYGWDLFKSN